MKTRLFCNAPTRGGRKCQSVLGVMSGRWTKVRELNAGEQIDEKNPHQHVFFCNDELCKAKWLVVQMPEAREAA
jgi:hypothetical protein